MAESLIKKIKFKGSKLLSVDSESIPWSNYCLNSVVTVMPGGQKKTFSPWEIYQGLWKGKRDTISFFCSSQTWDKSQRTMCINPIIATAIWESGTFALIPPSDLVSVPWQLVRAVTVPLDKDLSAIALNLHHWWEDSKLYTKMCWQVYIRCDEFLGVTGIPYGAFKDCKQQQNPRPFQPFPLRANGSKQAKVYLLTHCFS